eukprot:TRINITY_DN28056_c0_g1_i1.p1 TRINITY_DN28056_c0_g1~~TRINITY_DN28056_c0_g1_i1.p1  ORF type:complete len:603 (+),score=96.49 TRINITY_DN28056_c0_g1_i1:58-1866(+)
MAISTSKHVFRYVRRLCHARNVSGSLLALPAPRLTLRLSNVCPLMQRRWNSSGKELASQDDGEEEAWLAIRRTSFTGSFDSAVSSQTEAEDSIQPSDLRLDTALSPDLVNEAWRLAHAGHIQSSDAAWEKLAARLAKLELNATEAVLVLHAIVKIGCHNMVLLDKIVDRIESRYFSMELGLDHHPHLEFFMHDGSYQSLINNLPLSHKVNLILVRCTGRPSSKVARIASAPKEDDEKHADPKKAWKTADPVEMEEWERTQFAQGRIRVKRMRDVRARVNRMLPGKRLRATLAAQLHQSLPSANLHELAELSQVCAFSNYRILHGDLQDDFKEGLASRLGSLDTHRLLPYVLAFTSAMNRFEGSEGLRTWRRKLIPAVLKLVKSKSCTELLSKQRLVHGRLGGVAQTAGPLTAEQTPELAERAARLFVAVTSARLVEVDLDLYDSLSSPLRKLIEGRLQQKGTLQSEHLLSLETLADVMSACASCGVRSGDLPRLLAELFSAQFDSDSGRLALSEARLIDLCTIAHGLSVSADKSEKQLAMLWEIAEPKLRSSSPHLALMLINSIVRGGSEKLLTSDSVLKAVDEMLVQKMDYDSAALGNIAC